MPTPRRVAITVVASALLLVQGARSQQSTTIPSTRVRVTLRYHPRGDRYRQVIGWVLYVNSDTLAMQLQAGDSLRVPAGNIEHVSVSIGQVDRAGSGLLVGATMGLVAGGAIGALLFQTSTCYQKVSLDAGYPSIQPADCRVVPLWRAAGTIAVVGVPVGAIAGAWIGGLVHHDKWRPVRYPSLELVVAPTAEGVAVAARLPIPDLPTPR